VVELQEHPEVRAVAPGQVTVGDTVAELAAKVTLADLHILTMPAAAAEVLAAVAAVILGVTPVAVAVVD
jgi:hypothetical protein